jgi:hypothetical protein
MKEKNVTALWRLSRFCRNSGFVCVALGFIVIGLDLFLRDFVHLQVGIFIFICGYAFLKIGSKISGLLFDERTEV